MSLKGFDDPQVVEIQTREINEKLLKYNAELDPTGRRVSCYSLAVDQSMANESILTIEAKLAKLLDSEGDFFLESFCIYANKEENVERKTLTVGLAWRYISQYSGIQAGNIYIEQNDDEPVNHFRVIQENTTEGDNKKKKLEINEELGDFFLLLMQTLERYPQTLETEKVIADALLKRDFMNLESKLRPKMELNCFFNEDYFLKIVKHQKDELGLYLVKSKTNVIDFAYRRYRNDFVFHNPYQGRIAGKDLTIPNIDRKDFNIYRQMLDTARNSLRK